MVQKQVVKSGEGARWAADLGDVAVVLVAAFSPQLDVPEDLLDLGCLQDHSDDLTTSTACARHVHARYRRQPQGSRAEPGLQPACMGSLGPGVLGHGVAAATVLRIGAE